MVKLIIENKEIELSEDIQFALNREFEELSNPTTIINEWSKTISIPFTLKNNRTFGHLYSTDKMTVVGSSNVGLYFNPLTKLDFRLEWNNTLIMHGYAKMNEVKQVSGKGTYQITLFGQLGKVFQEMQKITFDASTDDPTYYIDGSEYFDETMNKELVYKSWTSTGQTYATLYPKYLRLSGGTVVQHPAYKVTDIVGFAPNNAFCDGFDYKAFQLYDSKSSGHTTFDISKEFTTILGTGFTQYTGLEPDTVIPDGLLPREIGEYRSYMQLPYIYWNKLFQMFQYKAESVTGYQFDLDPDWFTTTNPYWHNLVYMLRRLDTIQNSTYINKYKDVTALTPLKKTTLVTPADNSKSWKYDFSAKSDLLKFGIVNEQIPILSGDTKHFSTQAGVMDGTLTVEPVSCYVHCNLGSAQTLKIRNNGVFILEFYGTDGDRNVRLGTVCIKDSNSPYIPYGMDYTINVSSQNVPAGSYDWYFFQNQSFTFNIPAASYHGNFGVYFKISGYNAEPTLSGVSMFVNSIPSSVALGDITTVVQPKEFEMHYTPLTGKSFSKITFNNLWDNDFNLFEEVLKYCKMYRIGISIDELNKKIVFKPIIKYFQNYSIRNWTYMVDKSHEFITITPVTFQNKYVLFNYDKSDTFLGKDYNEKYGVNYGEYRLVTDYNFNIGTKQLFSGIKQSIVNTDNVLSWTNLYNNVISYSLPAEIFVYNKDKDKKAVSVFGSFFFHNGLATFDTEATLNLRTVHISDDTMFQQDNSTFFYTQTADDTQVSTTYPKLDIVRGDNLCVFNVPMKNYTYLDNYGSKHSIYYNFWEKYVNERYNIQNKQITCYITLKPNEYSQFSWGKLVRVGNQLCMVNKIYDYDITNAQTTKVDLITIQDIDGYTTNNYTA